MSDKPPPHDADARLAFLRSELRRARRRRGAMLIGLRIVGPFLCGFSMVAASAALSVHAYFLAAFDTVCLAFNLALSWQNWVVTSLIPKHPAE